MGVIRVYKDTAGSEGHLSLTRLASLKLREG